MVRFITVADAARHLGVTAQTVRNMLDDGRLRGKRGDQPVRRRRYVEVDDAGRPIGSNGPAEASYLDADSELPEVAGLEERMAALERGRGSGLDIEAVREIALALGESVDRQQRAMRLQAEAFEELNRAVAEQAAALRLLLMPTTPDDLSRRPPG